RGDVGGVYGAQFTNSGYGVAGSLGAGTYQVVAYAHSTVTGAFTGSTSIFLHVAGTTPAPVMSLDTPVPNAVAKRGFAVGGWAIDLGALSGTGVDTVHVWAFPTNGAPAIFAGVASYGAPRGDVGGVYGARFTNSGFNLAAATIPPGVYDLVAYAHSTVTGTFSNWRVARVTVQ
ncbi:MAG TPA: hypothetical protein VF921_21600, partial [Vicinamibacterales bacterium]